MHVRLPALLCFCLATFAASSASAAPVSAAASTPTVNIAPCVSYAPGTALPEPREFFSTNGVLRVSLVYHRRVDATGAVLYCYTMTDGTPSPTLHVNPGDELMITFKNDQPPAPPMAMHSMPGMSMPTVSVNAPDLTTCGNMVMTAASTNMHFHGTNVPPTCHQDEVINTLINAGETFQYDVHFPVDEPPGLYWYHPHIHGSSEAAVQGGASGAIIVDGIQNINREVASMPTRTLIIRDNPLPADADDGEGPGSDISVNYVKISYPAYTPSTVSMLPGQKQFWRVLNASADSIMDIQLKYDGVAQDLHVVGIDGVPTGSQDGTAVGKTVIRQHFLLAPAARVEFWFTGPALTVQRAVLKTLDVQTGPWGDGDPERPLVLIKASARASYPNYNMPKVNGGPLTRMRFTNLDTGSPHVTRHLYFSEVLSDPTDPTSDTIFFITVDGDVPKVFDPRNPPTIVTHQGAIEDWVVENRTLENHEFHIHQIHFVAVERDGKPVHGQYRDTIDIPFWSGAGAYPSVKLRMDFRGNYVGDFVYHCHILEHEDKGMMAVIRVLP